MATTQLPAAAPLAGAKRSQRSVIWILIGGALVVKAAGFSWDYLGYYVSDGAGYGTTAAGAALSVFGLGWCIGQIASGAITDRIGQRAALTLLMLVSAVACASLAAARSLPALLAVALFLGLTMDVQRPAISATINDSLTSSAARTRAQGWLYWSSNAGIAMCGAVGGYVAHHYGYRPLFVANGVACLLFALVANRTLPVRGPSARHSEIRYREVLRDPSLRWITAASLGAMVCAWGLVGVMPLLMTEDGLPPTAFGIAMVANTVAVLTLSPPLVRLLVGKTDTMRYPLVPILCAGCVCLGLAMSFAALQHTVVGYSLAAVCIVPGEILYSVAVGAYISAMAPPAATGRYQAVLSGSAALASLSPLGIALALSSGGRSLVAALLAASALLAVLACHPLMRALRSRDGALPTRAGTDD
ncbi:MFS transporter (plasmid) [Streptomyces sp. NBC_01724]|uniref:MFS transporter n=1 Tax=Streptomyces sp. NBC_01724 TaxID=2975922 RepID=UPI002E32F570|nr:MFS transporter [Streptomyces sp. NBC_01724]